MRKAKHICKTCGKEITINRSIDGFYWFGSCQPKNHLNVVHPKEVQVDKSKETGREGDYWGVECPNFNSGFFTPSNRNILG